MHHAERKKMHYPRPVPERAKKRKTRTFVRALRRITRISFSARLTFRPLRVLFLVLFYSLYGIYPGDPREGL